MALQDFLKTWRIVSVNGGNFQRDGLISLYEQTNPEHRNSPIRCLVSDLSQVRRKQYCSTTADRNNWEDASFRYDASNDRVVAATGVQGYFDFGRNGDIHWHDGAAAGPTMPGPGASWNGTED